MTGRKYRCPRAQPTSDLARGNTRLPCSIFLSPSTFLPPYPSLDKRRANLLPLPFPKNKHNAVQTTIARYVIHYAALRYATRITSHLVWRQLRCHLPPLFLPVFVRPHRSLRQPSGHAALPLLATLAPLPPPTLPPPIETCRADCTTSRCRFLCCTSIGPEDSKLLGSRGRSEPQKVGSVGQNVDLDLTRFRCSPLPRPWLTDRTVSRECQGWG